MSFVIATKNDLGTILVILSNLVEITHPSAWHIFPQLPFSGVLYEHCDYRAPPADLWSFCRTTLQQGSGDPGVFGCDTWTIIPLPSLSPAPPPSVYMCVYVSTPLSCFLQVHLSSHNILLGPCSDAESLPRPPLEQQTCSSVAQQRD